MKKAYLLVLSFIIYFSLRGRLQVYRTSRDSSDALRGQRSFVCASLASLHLTNIFRKKYIHSSGAPNFATVPWGHLKINLSGGQEGLPQDLHSPKTVCISLKKIFDMCTQLYLLTHSNILAWRIPWTEHPGRLQCIGWQSVGHD